ncbi:uncharacterized protein LOC134747956 [Cydia strobilella]|uniref:uncharacterized protein LOC134747956 n=1 Tax=Cydia strobilella TaxID=1100964 RepID=UPI003005263D
MTSKIVFKINGKQYEANGKFGPDVSLNEYIRTIADLRGTKAMCHEGGCGACIVSVRAATPPSDEMKTFAVNSCLVSILSCHGWEITTVEGVGNRNKGYHDIQTRLAKFNGTQCGYCTPGWIMNMYSLHTAKKGKLTTTEIENSFAGNICRCTGYRPISDAFKTFATDADKDLVDKLTDLEDLGMFKPCGVSCNKKCAHKNRDNDILLSKLNYEEVKEKSDDDWCIVEKANKELITLEYGAQKWYKAFTLEHVFEIIGMCKEYKLIAGNTGQGVYHVEKYPSNVIDIFNVAEIKGYTMDVNLVLGAGMTLTDMMEVFLQLSTQNEDFAYLKQFHEHMDLVAHIPVRNIGTIGGNLYLKYVNNEFQSDLFLLFETVGAMLTIAEGEHKTKAVTLPAFLKMNMKRKIILNIMLPPLSKWCSVKTYKIMPRSQNAHAVVNAGFLFKFKHNTNIIEKSALVFGSISANFIHAEKTESALIGKDLFTNDTVQLAVKTLFEEIKPEEAPPEPGAAYRRMLAVALFYKAVLYLCPDGKLDPRHRSGGSAIKRSTSQGTQTFDTDKSIWPLNQPIPKLEALVQCSGEATFANDLQSVTDEVYGAFVCADAKPDSIISGFDNTKAMKLPGVLAFYTAQDIPGRNSFTSLNVPLIVDEEEILCSKDVKFYGQPAAIIVANREKTANRAAKLVKVKYAKISERLPLLTVKDVLKSSEKTKRIKNNKTVEPVDIGNDIHLVLKGEFNLETQYHYYIEPQTCVVRPTEDGMEVYSATQWLDLTNLSVAQCLKMPANSVNVIVRRVGGSYGGKISRSVQIACAAALVSHLQNKTCRFIVPLQTNFKIAGKRIPTYSNFDVGVNKDGVIQYLKNTFYQDNGCSDNETISPITINHFLNCYDTRRWYIEANSVATDTPSNTWCRAPSSTEGVAMIENIMEQIAHKLNKDPLEVRLNNMNKEDNPVPDLIDQLKKDSDFENRSKEVEEFNKDNRWRKRALNLLPMAYDLFYIGNFNSIVSVLHGDGSVVITHGGIEMGQGINTKVAQVAAYILGVPLEKVSIKPSTSFTSPNSMTTGASIGSECVAFATMKACEILLERLEPIRAKMGKPSWEELVEKAYKAGLNLQASHMYSSNDGVKPYFIYGVIALELEVDILTGNHDIRRVDLLEDTGRSLSPEIDVGQIEGAFIMGLGYFTSEKTLYDSATGQLLTDRTWTYKPPGIKDIPADFRVYFKRNGTNRFGVLQSKATGEPSLCLSSVVVHALRHAIRSARLDAGQKDEWIEMGLPCTVENIFTAVGHKLEDFKLKRMQLPRHLKVAAGSAGAAIFGILFGWVIFPAILKSQLKKEMALTAKTDVRQMWQKIPFPLDFKVYLYNYTNAAEVQKGAIPIVQEVGPYYFEEWKEKVEVEENDAEDTINYKKLDVFYFKPEKSGPGLTGEEVITMPHPFMLGMATVVYRDKPAMLNMIGKAINGIFDNPEDMFLRVKAMDVLFRGLTINCARTEFAPKAVCTTLKKEGPPGLILEPNNQFRFSIFGARNGTVDPKVVTVNRGKKNVMDVGRVLAVDGKDKQNLWRDHCNEYGGTDGTVFPPFLTEFDKLQTFSGDLCRSFKPWYQKKTSYRGIKTNRYIANIGDLANDPELNCFCDAPDKCPLKGLMDVTKCVGAPMYVSMPHFLDSDPSLVQNCKGLNPDVNEHGIEIDFEPISGTPMVARQRVQFSMLLLNTDKLELCKNMPNTYAPLFWIEEGLALNKTFVNMLKHQLFYPKRAVGVIKWMLVSFGTLGALGGALFHFKGGIMNFAVSKNSASVTKIKPEEEAKEVSVIGNHEPAKVM